ncbi:uncharacterized protein LOC133802132 isoform X2 [Humulus lupulus]|uniref:uncharacterized protein LOC133802132 isoform X2 n=1 Tax=Humulus lupulus TaxID=3486 RepID=UPI002B415414|nr:uncharacterized protein LOC133802132 isoform X2 [Humulus lupulus]
MKIISLSLFSSIFPETSFSLSLCCLWQARTAIVPSPESYTRQSNQTAGPRNVDPRELTTIRATQGCQPTVRSRPPLALSDGDGEEVWVWARGVPRLRCGLNDENTTSLLIPSNVKTDPRNSPKPSSTTTFATTPMAPTSLEHLLVQMEDSIVKMQGMLLKCYSTRVNDGICGCCGRP